MEHDCEELEVVVERVRSRATCTIADAAVLLTTSRNRVYAMARESGSVCGLPVIRVGAKNLRLPSAALLRLVGLDVEVEG